MHPWLKPSREVAAEVPAIPLDKTAITKCVGKTVAPQASATV